MGPSPEKAKKIAPNSIRAIYGTDVRNNACHGADSKDAAQRELNIFFKAKQSTIFVFLYSIIIKKDTRICCPLE